MYYEKIYKKSIYVMLLILIFSSAFQIAAFAGENTLRSSPDTNKVYYLRNARSNKYLDTYDGLSAVSGRRIVQNNFRGDETQLFRFIDEDSGYYSLRPLANESLRVDIINASDTNGAEVQLFSNNPSYGSQKFKVEYRGNTMVTLRPYLSSTRVLEVRNSSVDNNAVVQLYTYDSNLATMHWFLEKASTPGIETNETYYIRNKATNGYLDVQGGNIAANGANVGNYTFNGGGNQKWVVTRNSNSTYTLKTSYNSNYVLDVNGNNVDIWSNGYPADQQFTIIRDSANNNGGYFIKIKGKYVTASGENTLLQDISVISSSWSFERVKKADATIISHSSSDPWFAGDAANNLHKSYFNAWGHPAYAFNDSLNSGTAVAYLKTNDVWVHSQHGGMNL